MRLNKYLATAGIASRRKCDEIIRSGQVEINGAVVYDFSTQVSDDDIVLCQGKLIEIIQEKVVYMLNKPKGYISTVIDTHKRKTVIDLIPTKDRLFPVGRLDRDTTGILLLTNDGDLAYKLTHPKFGIERKYIVLTKIDIPNEKLTELGNGTILDSIGKVRAKVKRLKKTKTQIMWEVVLKEGKNREVRKIFKELGSKVDELHRYEFAGLSADKLKIGKYKRLNKIELKKLTDIS
ncbi:MAG: rRNA pseudouridine synthase [Candidatus Marinimicrobia bacterium]|nr:rRNA pseudouridine synthase [Candidatus Neomarinimicrobiota bacterium]MBL7022630.1 rRNA pseudouridine synthase [Candidatus Neomarinimicrobiota bacterium]MBL7109627.1 rRNA pseudouridine synthase [Candidatus Neomarinimicrobiota bacterium]